MENWKEGPKEPIGDRLSRSTTKIMIWSKWFLTVWLYRIQSMWPYEITKSEILRRISKKTTLKFARSKHWWTNVWRFCQTPNIAANYIIVEVNSETSITKSVFIIQRLQNNCVENKKFWWMCKLWTSIFFCKYLEEYWAPL